MDVCLNCGKPIQNTPGKKAKKYCSGSCRTKHWQKENSKKKDSITIPISEWERIQSLLGEKEVKIVDAQIPAVVVPEPKPKIRYVEPHTPEVNAAIYNATHDDSKVFVETIDIKEHNDKIDREILRIQSEPQPSHITSTLGRKAWKFDMNKKIEELKKQLK